MSFETFIAKRYLSFRKDSPHSFLISIFAVIGIVVGVMTLITVIAVMTGAQSYFKNQLLRATPHITLQHINSYIEFPVRVSEQLKKNKNISAITPHIYTQGLLQTSTGNAPVIIKGVAENADAVLGLPSSEQVKSLYASTHSSDFSSIFLGKELATQLKIKPGDTVSLILPTMPARGSGSTELEIPSAYSFRVIGTFTTGMYDFDKVLSYISLSDAQAITQMGRAVTGFDIRVPDANMAHEISLQLNREIGFPLVAQPWTSYYQEIFAVIQLQKVVLFIVFALIILVAAFNIASTLILMVMEKQRDISILRAMGTKSFSISKIFLVKGFVIGISGALGGICLGLLGSFILSHLKFIELPAEVYNFSRLPIKINGIDVGIIFLLTLFLCFLCSLYPAWKAARIPIIDGLK